MISVRDIINICDGKLICGNDNTLCKSFSKDTREINSGDVFVGIRGDVYDGNTFYKEAIKNGASVVILDNKEVIDEVDDKYTIVLVDDSLEAIAKLAKYKRSLYDIPVVAVTGSVGKTSVKDIIYKVLSTQYKVLCTKGNMNNHIGLPFTILGLDDHNTLVVEMGMNHFNEIHNLSNIAKPTIAVITNIGTAHIGNLGSRENILKAKLEILDGMLEGTLIINNDDDLLRTVKYEHLITIGIENDSDYMAKEIEFSAFKSNFYIGDDYISLPIGSKAFIYNALFAYAVGIKLGISRDNIINALEEFKLSPHRLEVINCKNYTIIDDTYNASLDSVKNSLSLLNKVSGRKVFIFADILETSDFGKEIHQEVAKSCIENKIDMVICVGNLSKYTYEVLNDKMDNCFFYENNNDLLKEIDNIINDGDTILVKGSHSMNLLEVVDYLKKNDDDLKDLVI